MKAVRIHGYGGPEVIRYEDASPPTIAADEVLVAVHATSINPVDLATRAGHFQNKIPVMFPWTLGLDLSGVVAKVGPNVTGFAIGDAVFGYSNMMRQGPMRSMPSSVPPRSHTSRSRWTLLRPQPSP